MNTKHVIIALSQSEPWMRERRIKDARGRILYSRYKVYAKLAGRTRVAHLCTFDTSDEALAYMAGLRTGTPLD